MTVSKCDLCWKNDSVRQRLWVDIDSCWYKVFVESYQSHRTLFQFEGTVSGGSGLIGLHILGDIEVPTEVLYPAPSEAPPEGHGWFHLIEDNDKPFGSVTLLVNQVTYAELCRVFSSNMRPKLELHLKHPRGNEPDFWRESWRAEDVQISHFGVYSGWDLRSDTIKPVNIGRLSETENGETEEHISTSPPITESKKILEETDDLSSRVLCVDGSCIGVIGVDGRCKVCGRLYPDDEPP